MAVIMSVLVRSFTLAERALHLALKELMRELMSGAKLDILILLRMGCLTD